MKRCWVLGFAMLLCGMVVGCASDTHVGLIADTIVMIDQAAAEVGNIKSRVKDAVEKHEKEGKKFDLTEAMKATDKLKDTGEEAKKINRRIEQVRGQITDEERQSYAKSQRDKLNSAFADLLKQKEELRKELARAEQLGSSAKAEVEKLREKIRDAESPFESLAR